MEAGDGPMIGRIRQWFTHPPETRGYIDQILSQQLAAASGSGSVRDTGIYQACLNLLSDAASTATLRGRTLPTVLQPLLGGDRAFDGFDTGQSDWLIHIGVGRVR